ncbi:MAG: SGNH/GDSL hydrolase family protein [Thermoleophilaceae bacterium]
MTVRCYLALGDSFTAGTEAGIRWPDAVAESLGASRYENLAWDGATSEDVERGQLEPGLALEPDLVSLVCGANDVLYSVRPDPLAYASRLGRMFSRIREAVPDADVVTATYPDIGRFLELRERSRARVRRGIADFNEICRSVAGGHGVLCLDWADHPDTTRPDYRGEDGFHPSEDGHRRAAAEVLAGLSSARKEQFA